MGNRERHLEQDNADLRTAGQRLTERLSIAAGAVQELTTAHDLLTQLVMVMLHERQSGLKLDKKQLIIVDPNTHCIRMENVEGVLHVDLEEKKVEEPEHKGTEVACDCGLDAFEARKNQNRAGQPTHIRKGKHGPKCAARKALKQKPDNKFTRVAQRICLLHRIYFEGQMCPSCIKETGDAALKGARSAGDGQDPLPAGEVGGGTEDGATASDSVPDVHAGGEAGGTEPGESTGS